MTHSGTSARAARAEMIERLWRNAALQMADIERRIAQLGGRKPVEQERDARSLGALVKLLREIAATDTPDKAEADHDDDAPRDIEQFRQELVRRMDEIVSRRAAGAGGGAEAG